MEVLRFANVRKDYGHRLVLRDVSFRINAGQKAGLIGANGAGKTSIIRLITGEEPASGGAITRAPSLRVGYVPQHVEDTGDMTAMQRLLAGNTAAHDALRAAEAALATASSDALDASMTSYDAAHEAYEHAGGDAFPSRAAGMLDALGLAGRAETPVRALSGGEKNVLSLAGALLAEPELLVLDEPGNHLDFAGIAWLEDFLAKFAGAVLIVSHNRYLLDRVVDTIFVLEDGAVREYPGNYSAYRATQLRDKLAQRADYVANQKRLAQLEELVKRFQEYAKRTADPKWGKRLRARKSQLEREREQAVERPAAEASKLKLRLNAEGSRADVALQVRGYSKAFGERVLFDDASLDIATGDRVALVGPNGAGKTTLLRDIIDRGDWGDAHIRIGPSLRVGYCAQSQETLDDARTVIGEILQFEGMNHDRAFNVLRQFLFTRDDLDKRVGMLSGGERNRLQLAKLNVQQPDFLILDEPTNHLDIPACEVIEDVLSSFKGTVLLVSHDRYLLDKIADRVIELRDGGFAPFEGNFSEFWLSRQAERRQTARVATRAKQRDVADSKGGAQPPPAVNDGARTSRGPHPPPAAASGARTTDVAALQRRIEEAEAERLRLEQRVSAAFTRGDHREGAAASKQLERHRARLDDLYEQWAAAEA
jgi:ATP-binding cassette subfamily F protein 3